MKICAKCGASETALTRTRLATYEDKVMGYDVVLVNAVDRFTCECGHELDVVTNQEGLIAAVGLTRVHMPYKLFGPEIRSLRKALGLKSVEFANKIDVTAETMSRWENGERLSDVNERALRLVTAASLSPRAPLIDVNFDVLTSMKFLPVRPANIPALWFEMVRTKTQDRKKDDQWDMAEAA